ncbi:MAG TPA: hypothetical protein VEA59_06260 [Patescibacteria group bacterium]|nr:hypothetical protein [Patescibacteria group bacterium]
MQIQTVPEITFVENLKNNFAEVVKTAASKKTPVFVLNGTKPEAVLLDYVTWLEFAEQSQRGSRRSRGPARAVKAGKVK